MLVIDAISSPDRRSRGAGAAAARLERDAALRRAGSTAEARDHLRLAVDLAHRCGATALEAEALAELRAAGGRPRRRLLTGAGALTPSERRTAELAAAGRQNREIAEALVVTLATVEFHLRNAYRKLGIASRTELGEALGVVAPPHRGAPTPALSIAVAGGEWASRTTAATATAS
jgi:DNA-binding CsgD family transcriptional regulator